MVRLRVRLFKVFFTLLLAALAQNSWAQSSMPIYTESLVNGFQDWSWASRNLANTSPVHSGSKSISVTASAWQALSFWHSDLNAAAYTNLSFWINGGSAGGQKLQ